MASQTVTRPSEKKRISAINMISLQLDYVLQEINNEHDRTCFTNTPAIDEGQKSNNCHGCDGVWSAICPDGSPCFDEWGSDGRSHQELKPVIF